MTFATYEKSGRVTTVTLNRPESRNALNLAMFLVALSVWYARRDFALTIEEARRRLDEIERDEIRSRR